MRRNGVAAAICLGGALLAGLLLLLPRVVQSAPPVAAPQSPAAPSADVAYYRTQTVTLYSPATEDIYTAVFSTAFQISIASYPLTETERGGWLNLPSDAITHAFSCVCDDPDGGCLHEWGTNRIYFWEGDTCKYATIYLEYDTWEKAHRDQGSELVTLAYPIGIQGTQIALTNTVIFTREIGPPWELDSVDPSTNYIYDSVDSTLTWIFTSTPWREYTANFVEPLLGSDLVIERLEMSNPFPEAGEPVDYTITVRNTGAYTTGQAVAAELFVRLFSDGPPTGVKDRDNLAVTGVVTETLFKWEGTSPPSHWWAGLDPGEAVVGHLTLAWPEECDPGASSSSQYLGGRDLQSTAGAQVCGVWAKVDPTCLPLHPVYDWWGYNAEGFGCGKADCSTGEGQITCEAELNNIKALYQRIYLPLVMRNSTSSGGD